MAADLFEWFAEEGKRAYRTPLSRLASATRRQDRAQTADRRGRHHHRVEFSRLQHRPRRGRRARRRLQRRHPAVGVHAAHRDGNDGISSSRPALPVGVANLVVGEADPIGQEMLRAPGGCAKIHLTGSVPVGKRLMDGASKTMTRLSLELRRQRARCSFFPTYNLKEIAAGAIAAKFRNARPGVYRAAAVPRRAQGGRRVHENGSRLWSRRCGGIRTVAALAAVASARSATTVPRNSAASLVIRASSLH